MDTGYGYARIVTGLHIPVYLLAFLWFVESFDTVTLISFVTLIFVVCIVPFTAGRALTSPWERLYTLTLCTIGIAADLTLIYQDMTAKYGADWAAALIRLILLIALVVITKRLLLVGGKIKAE